MWLLKFNGTKNRVYLIFLPSLPQIFAKEKSKSSNVHVFIQKNQIPKLYFSDLRNCFLLVGKFILGFKRKNCKKKHDKYKMDNLKKIYSSHKVRRFERFKSGIPPTTPLSIPHSSFPRMIRKKPKNPCFGVENARSHLSP